MKTLALVALVFAVTLVAGIELGRACSCIPPDPWKLLREADGAIVGRLVDRRDAGDGRATLTFRVERAVKGNIGATVEVETANNGAACGIETSVGQRIGLFLVREDDAWVGHLCWQVAPGDLLAAAALPAPTGNGPVAMFVGGRFGPARTLALDARGRTLAYGLGRGTAFGFAVCPGGRRVAELVVLDTHRPPYESYIVAIRELTSLRLVRTQPLKHAFPGPIRCTSADADRLIVFLGSGPDLDQRARLVTITPKGATTIWRGWAFHASLTKRLAYVTEVYDGLLAVDPVSRSIRKLATLPRDVHYLIPNAERTRFASVAYKEGVGNPRLVVVDTRRRPASVRTAPLPNATGYVLWFGRTRLVLLQKPTALIFDADLRVVSRFRWLADQSALVGSTAFGVHKTGRLVTAKVPSGPMRLVRRLPGTPYVIVSVRD